MQEVNLCICYAWFEFQTRIWLSINKKIIYKLLSALYSNGIQMKKGRQRNLFFLITLFLLIILFGSIYYYHSRKTNQPHTIKYNANIMMTQPPLTKRQKIQLASGSSTTTNGKTFYITDGNFYFVPNKITANQGDKIAIVLTNTVGLHNFVITDLQVKSRIFRPGQIAIINFIANKKGTYTFYSNLPQDMKQDMKGTLIVQ